LDINPTSGVFFMTKYNEKQKLEIVQEYLSGSMGAESLGKKYGIGRTSVVRWIAGYREHGGEGLRRKYSPYSAEFKLSVLRAIQQQELSHAQAAVFFDLRDAGAIARWRRQYHEGGPQALNPKPRGRPPKTMTTPKPQKAPQAPPPQDDAASALQALRKENEYLRAEVAYLKKLEALVRARRQAAPKERKPSSS
jgi:transposase